VRRTLRTISNVEIKYASTRLVFEKRLHVSVSQPESGGHVRCLGRDHRSDAER
jgi:hypothetical protein